MLIGTYGSDHKVEMAAPALSERNVMFAWYIWL